MQKKKLGIANSGANLTLSALAPSGSVLGMSESPKAYSGLKSLPETIHIDRHSGGSLQSACAQRALQGATPYARAESFQASLSLVFTQKIKFAGKGYRIRKSLRGKSARMGFGHSHRVNTVFASCRLLRLAKQKYLLFSNRMVDLSKDAILVRGVREPSPYTKRGLRLSRATAFKRPGKKSTY